MSKISELFKMHNIKYIISVDDCYSTSNIIDELRAIAYTVMITNNINLFTPIFDETSYESKFKEIVEMSSIGIPIDDMVVGLLDLLDEHQLENCINTIDDQLTSLLNQKKSVMAFLTGLKEERIIEEFITVKSTQEAIKYDVSELNNGAILWLVDQDFSKAGESNTAGLQLAEDLIGRNEDNNYIYIVSAIEKDSDLTEEMIEAEFDKLLNDKLGETVKNSFCYFIHKSKIETGDQEKIAKSLAQGFRRKANFIIIDKIEQQMKDGLDSAKQKIKLIDQKTLNYVISEKVIKQGESCFDFVARMIKLLFEDEFNKNISENFDEISKELYKYKELYNNDICVQANVNTATKVLKELRHIELFDNNINTQYREISFGDVFEIKGLFYILVSQPCDITLRNNGKRKLNSAILLQIEENKQGSIYELSCFESFNKPTVNLQSYITVPFDLLDLCTLNNDGQASLSKHYLQDKYEPLPNYFSDNFKKRFSAIIETIKPITVSKSILENVINNSGSDNTMAKDAYSLLTNTDSIYKVYLENEEEIKYPILRIAKICEIEAISIAQAFTGVFSRIGLPFNFIKTSAI